MKADRDPRDGRLELREWLDFAVERVPSLFDDAKDGKVSRRGIDIVPVGDATGLPPPQQPRAFYRPEIEAARPLVLRMHPSTPSPAPDR